MSKLFHHKNSIMDNHVNDTSNGNMSENPRVPCHPGLNNMALPNPQVIPRPNLKVNPQPARPGPVCPGAPSKRRRESRRESRRGESLQEEASCCSSLEFRYLDQGVTSCEGVTRPMAPRKELARTKLSLRLNTGILPRPFQSGARRDLMSLPAPGANIARIMGVDDPAENWIDLDTIHRNPINRAGNPQAPPAPRKSRRKMADWFGSFTRKMLPKRLDFESDSETSESKDDSFDIWRQTLGFLLVLNHIMRILGVGRQ